MASEGDCIVGKVKAYKVQGISPLFSSGKPKQSSKLCGLERGCLKPNSPHTNFEDVTHWSMNTINLLSVTSGYRWRIHNDTYFWLFVFLTVCVCLCEYKANKARFGYPFYDFHFSMLEREREKKLRIYMYIYIFQEYRLPVG